MLEDELLLVPLADEEDGGTELDEEGGNDDDELLDEGGLLDDAELDGGTLEDEPLLELDEEPLDEDALAELEAGGGCVPVCVRCGLRLLRGCRCSCRFRSGLRSASANAFFLRRFIENQPSAFSFQQSAADAERPTSRKPKAER